MDRRGVLCRTAVFLQILLLAAPCRSMPHFTSTSYSVTVSEATPVGSILINVTAVPGTPGNPLTYHIFNNPPIFIIDNSTGSITLVGTLDYEEHTSHQFNVEVFEGSDVVMEPVTVNVVNVDDNPLTCDQTLVVVLIPEGPPTPSTIPLNCVDRDEPLAGSVSYHIQSGNDTGLFSIDTDGMIHIRRDLDYEEQTVHELSVNATSGGMLAPPTSDSTLLLTVLIVVEPVNEFNPAFENDETMFTFSVSESAAVGAAVGTVHASDADQGKDGELWFVFSASESSELTQIDSVFSIGYSTGQITLIGSLDYEQTVSHELTVIVTDSSQEVSERRSATASVLIHVMDVNEYNPVFSQEVYSVSVSELGIVGSEVTTLQCTDQDSHNSFTYSIESSNNTNHFNIDSLTGIVTLATEVEFDPTSPSSLQVTVHCEDSGSPSRSAQAALFVSVEGHSRNLPPLLHTTEYLVDLNESSSLGTTVVSLASVAADRNRGLAGPLQFSLVFNVTCPHSIFHMDSTSGTLYTVGFVNYETSEDYHCVVLVSNTHSSASYAELDVFIRITNINDKTPLCLQTLYTLTIPEDSTVGSELLTISCSDADGDILGYSLVENSSVFQLTQSGTQTAALSLLAPVNSDVFSTHLLHVTVSDGQHTLQIAVFVYVKPSNEHVPTFHRSIYDCSVSEITDIGSIICTVVAADGDSGPDGEISYTINSGNDDNIFAMNSKSGEIVLSGHVDYELIQGYHILVQASDHGNPPLSSSVQVRITVLDNNDNAPIISPLITATITENSAVGSVVTDIVCVDVDSGSNGDVTLTIESLSAVNSEGIEVDETGVFSIDSLTQELILESSPDYETSILYTFTLTCRDNGSLTLSSSSTVIVSISPLNEFAPAISQVNYSTTIAENSGIGTSVLQIIATDNDSGPDGNVVFSIESEGSGIAFLQISSTSGLITTRQLLNCDWGREHSFIITATDRGAPAVSSQSQLQVTIEGCHLGQLRPRENIYFASVIENAPTDTEVITVACDAERAWEGGRAIEYSIQSPTDSPFQIDSTEGRLSVLIPPDYEQAISYMLQLRCSDPNDSESYGDFSVYVTILPENEHQPVFTLSMYETDIAEDVSPGTSILRVKASDDDSGNDGAVEYSIQETASPFALDSRTGVVYTRYTLDREKESSYVFHVIAMDQLARGSGTQSSVAEVRVSVVDTNDNSPTCDRVVYHTIMSPLSDPRQQIFRLQCTDADAGLNSELHYSLHAESTSSLEMFSLDENTGELVLAREFDSNSALVHQMTVTIEDGGTPSLSTVALVLVELQSEPVVSGEVVEGGKSPVGAEGAENSATLTLTDMSIKLWNAGGKKSFQSAMAHSVTQYCAVFPEACSLLSGCAHFYRMRKRSTNEHFFTVFSEDDVIFLPQSTHEFPGSDRNAHLNLSFYVTLPEGIQKTEYRTTDYVIPGTTLSLLLRDDQPMIESQVRGSVAPPLTQQQGVSTSGWVWAVVTSVVLMCVCIAVIATVCTCKCVLQKSKKKGVTIFPLNVTSKGRPWSDIHTPTHGKDDNQQNRSIPLHDLVRFNTSANRVERGQSEVLVNTSDSFDDVSTIDLVSTESNEYSLQGQPSSNKTPTPSSSTSAGNSGKSPQSSCSSQDSLGDYRQNFPYEPPRKKGIYSDRPDCTRLMRTVQPAVGGKRIKRIPPFTHS